MCKMSDYPRFVIMRGDACCNGFLGGRKGLALISKSVTSMLANSHALLDVRVFLLENCK